MNSRTDTTGPNSLLGGLAAGEESAFRSLYDQLGARLYRTALGLLGRREDAEDAVQEVFLSLVQSRRRLSAVKDLTAYVFTALRHSVGRSLARRRREAVASAAAADGEVPRRPSAEYVSDRAQRVEMARRSLPPEQREVLTLKIEGELTIAEIGHLLGVSPNTAASRYRYALEKLRTRLGESES